MEELMVKDGKERTGAGEAGTGPGPGRPPLPAEERKRRKNAHDRESRANKKFEREILEAFAALPENIAKYRAFNEDHRKKSSKEIQMILKNFSKNPWATLEENIESEVIQTVGIEGVAAMNSSSVGVKGTPFEQARELKRKREEGVHGACRGKRPATTYSATPSSGFMVEARQKDHQLAAALAIQGPLLLTNKGTQIQMREAAHDKEASTSSWAPPPHHELGLGSKQEVSVYNLMKQYVKLKDAKRGQQEAAAAFIGANRKFKEKKKEVDNSNKQVKGEEEVYKKLKAELAEKNKISKDALDLQKIDAVTLGWNLMKELLQSMHIGSEFLNLPLLDTIQLYPSLQHQFNEGLTLIGQGHPIDDRFAVQSDNPPVVVPRSFFWYYNMWENDVAWEPNVFAPLGDAANIAANSPQFQAANARANNGEQEDDANDQEDRWSY